MPPLVVVPYLTFVFGLVFVSFAPHTYAQCQLLYLPSVSPLSYYCFPSQFVSSQVREDGMLAAKDDHSLQALDLSP